MKLCTVLFFIFVMCCCSGYNYKKDPRLELLPNGNYKLKGCVCYHNPKYRGGLCAHSPCNVGYEVKSPEFQKLVKKLAKKK